MVPSLLRRAFELGRTLSRRAIVAPPASTLAAACLLLGASIPAWSADERVVVTATRSPQASDAVIADVVVIDAEQIARAGPIGLAELLQRHAGAEPSSTGGPGQVSGVFLRGTNSSHVVVLIDGVRINSATTGTNALEHLPLAQIEHIEVLRGPASSLYGADAIGGVIQIFTRRPDGVTARARVGSDNLRELDLGAGQNSGDTRWSLNAGTLDVRAFSSTNATHPFSFNPDDDPYRDNHLNAQLQHRWAEGHRIALRGFVSSANTHFDAGLGSDDVGRQRLTSLALESEDRFTGIWRSTVRLARGSDHQRSEGGAFPSRFHTDQDQLTWQNDLRLGTTDIALGADWRREAVTSDTAFTQTSRRIGAIFAGASTRLDALQLEGSLRTDHSSQFGSHTTGRFGAGWAFATDWRLSAAAGTAFKAPTFNDLYFPLSFGFSGNPDLKPERSRGFDAALRYRNGGTAFGIAGFYNRIVDLIAVDPTFSTVINVNRARIRGTTLSARQAWGGVNADVEWTHQSPRDATTDTLLVRRARDHGRAGLSFDAGVWRAGADVVASGARFDSTANSPGSRMAGYALLSLHAAWRFTPDWTASARVNNATDKRYELAQGYNTAPRQFVLGVDARFR